MKDNSRDWLREIKMKSRTVLIALLGISLVVAETRGESPRKAGPLSSALLEELVRNDHEVGDDVAGRCVWPDGNSIPYRFDFTSKGNGRLQLGGQMIRVYDYHEDGSRYEDGFLQIDLISKRGMSLLVFTGMAQWSDEKGGRVIHREPVSLIFALDKKQHLELVFANQGADRFDAWEHKGDRSREDWIEFFQKEDERKHSLDRR